MKYAAFGQFLFHCTSSNKSGTLAAQSSIQMIQADSRALAAQEGHHRQPWQGERVIHAESAIRYALELQV